MKKWAISAIIYLLVITGGYFVYTNYVQTKETNHTTDTHGNETNEHNTHGEHEESNDQISAKVDFTFVEKPQSGKTTELNINVTNEDGKPIKDFELEHEKLMHLIVVSKDLSYFDHIHPEYKGDGLFTISPKFQSGGEYKLFSDFVPKGGSKIVKSFEVNVEGQSKPTKLVADQTLTKVVDGKEITLTFDHLMTNMEIPMTFTIKDAKTKKPITNLQPYLGAIGHVVAISGDTETYLHVHPMDENSQGPDAKFMTSFPKEGLYKIWGQFQHEGKVFIVPFTVNVQ